MQLTWPEANEPIDLQGGDVHVWAVPLDGTDKAVRRLAATLNDDEQRRAARFLAEEPRRRFVISRAALRTILAHHLRTAPADVPVEYDLHGKPQLPERTNDLYFNLAHSGGLALVAVTEGCAVGVDVERVRPVRQWDQIAIRYFSVSETEAIMAAEESERQAAFLRCWTHKEAILKAIGVGLGYPLDAFAVPIAESVDAWVELPGRESKAPIPCWLTHASPSAEYVGAVATLGQERRAVWLTYRL